MTVSSKLQEYRTQAEQQKEAWLGELLWYTVSETTVDYVTLKKVLEANGLGSYVPRAPRDEDVFRRVAPNGHKKKISTTNDEIHVNYLIRQVKRGGGSCTKHIVAETVDSSGETLDYEEVYSLFYDGDVATMVVAQLGAGDATAEEIAHQLLHDFKSARGRVDAAAVRGVIRRVLDDARAVNVRPTGGVYFVMPQYSPLVEALENVAAELPGAFVHPLPLLDDRKQRDMLKRAYETETAEEADRMLSEISGMLGNKDSRVTPDFYARLSARFTRMKDRNAEYTGLLEDALGGADSKLTILRRQMTALLRRVE